MEINKYKFEMSTRSIALGVVIGITLTAVIVGILSFLAVSDINRSIRSAMDKLRSSYNNSSPMDEESEADFSYPAPEAVLAVDTDSWLTFINDEFGFSFKYPEDWELTAQGEKDCTKPEVSENCFEVFVSELGDEGDPRSIMISTSGELKDQKELTKFPTVMYFSGKEKIFQQFRKATCTFKVTGGQNCTPNPEGHLQFTHTQFKVNGKTFELFVFGNPNLELAGILNSVEF